MLQAAVLLSIQILAIHLLFNKSPIGMPVKIAFANMFDKLFGKKASKIIQSPLWDCFICMSSVWTILLSWSVDPLLIIAVCGVNIIINKLIDPDAENA